jgi:hypothetical protein
MLILKIQTGICPDGFQTPTPQHTAEANYLPDIDMN